MNSIRLLLICLTLVASSCATRETSIVGTPADQPATTEPIDMSDPFGGLDHPPEVTVTAGEDAIATNAWAYCWTANDVGICADGERPDPIPTLATDGPIRFTFAIPGWSFEPVVDDCDSAEVSFNQVDDTTWEVTADGQFELVTIDLFGRPPGGGGDAIYSFAVQRLTDGGSSDGVGDQSC